MNYTSQSPSKSLPPTEYILKLHAPEDKIAVLLLNRGRGQTLRRVASLEGKKNLLRLQQDSPLTEAEANAVEDGANAFEKLLTQLTDVPTPAGPTPRQLQSGLVQIEPTKERRK